MDLNEFDNSEYERHRNEYSAEAEARWGSSRAWAQSKARTKDYSRERWAEITAEQQEVLKGFAALRDGDANTPEARAQVERWRDFITANFYDCTPEHMRGLSEMYVSDERFMRNIDKMGEGTAEFIARAVAAYLDN